MRRARRRLLTALLAGGLTLLSLGWLSLGAGNDGASGRYVEAVIGPPVRVNPLAMPTNDAEDDLAALVFSGLTRIGADGLPIPDLAQSCEVTPDGLTYTFRLRPGLAWHDGAPFSADDVAFTIARIQAPEFDGATALAAGWSGVQVRAADRLTVELRIPEPAAGFLVRAALGLLPRHLAGAMNPATVFGVAPFNRHPVGTGPYRLRSLDNRRALLDRYRGFALGAPAIGRIELRFVANVEAQVAALRAGGVDAALLGERPAAGELAMLDRRRELVEVAMPRSAYTALYMNNAAAPLATVAVRRALAASIDRAAVLAASGLRGAPGEGVLMPGSWAYQPPAPGIAADVEDRWRKAGFASGADGARTRGGAAPTLELVTNDDSAREAMARAIAQQLGAQGVTVTVVTMPAHGVIAERLRPGAYQLALFGWEAAADPDPYPGWHSAQAGGAGGNVAGFRDAEADALMEAARTTPEVAERRALYARLGERFEERAPVVVLAYPARAYVHPVRLQGAAWGLLVTPGSRFWDVFRWRLR